MKKLAIAFISWVIAISIYGQEIVITVAPTVNFAVINKSNSLVKDQSLMAGIGSSIKYIFVNNHSYNFGLGLGYHYAQVKFTNYGDFVAEIPYTETVNLFSFNLISAYNFKNNFYLNFEPSIDFHFGQNESQTIDNQSGVGLNLGLGKKVKIKDNLSFIVEPGFGIHNIIPFSNEKHINRLATVELNLGLLFIQRKVKSL
jgi:putative salt-induced outer membrane protein YdiY